MSIKKHIVIFSHGFGVCKDDHGLFTDIAKELPEVESVLFDYYKLDVKKNILTICSFSEQVKKLNKIINKIKKDNPGAIIDLICHSQGTVIAALAKIENIRKVLFLAPVFDMGLKRTLVRYKSRMGAEINLKGVSKLPALDGLIRVIPAQYWQEREKVNSFDEYNLLAKKTELIIIKAKQDQILLDVNLSQLSNDIKLMELDGKHNFGGKARKPLIKIIRKYILY